MLDRREVKVPPIDDGEPIRRRAKRHEPPGFCVDDRVFDVRVPELDRAQRRRRDVDPHDAVDVDDAGAVADRLEPEADLARMAALVLSQREAVPVAKGGIEQRVGVWSVVRALARDAVGVSSVAKIANLASGDERAVRRQRVAVNLLAHDAASTIHSPVIGDHRDQRRARFARDHRCKESRARLLPQRERGCAVRPAAAFGLVVDLHRLEQGRQRGEHDVERRVARAALKPNDARTESNPYHAQLVSRRKSVEAVAAVAAGDRAFQLSVGRVEQSHHRARHRIARRAVAHDPGHVLRAGLAGDHREGDHDNGGFRANAHIHCTMRYSVRFGNAMMTRSSAAMPSVAACSPPSAPPPCSESTPTTSASRSTSPRGCRTGRSSGFRPAR